MGNYVFFFFLWASRETFFFSLSFIIEFDRRWRQGKRKKRRRRKRRRKKKGSVARIRREGRRF